MLLAALLITLFIATAGTLMLLGWRHRPSLEIPPRLSPSIELPLAYRRRRRRLVVIGYTAYLLGVAGFLGFRALELRTAAIVVGAFGAAVWFGALVLRVAGTFAMARRVRDRAAREGPSQ